MQESTYARRRTGKEGKIYLGEIDGTVYFNIFACVYLMCMQTTDTQMGFFKELQK